MAKLLVIQHVPYEGLGTFEPVFTQRGCTLVRLHPANPHARWPRLTNVQGVVIMGGPMGVYEQDRYPFLTKELAFLREAVEMRLPILGVCLGAQLLAHALGADVRKHAVKEIGWYPLTKEAGAADDPLFAPFTSTETVFQWHGDTFALPRGAVRLASSPWCAQQAFRYRDNVYGLQFHVEVTADIIAAWLGVPENTQALAGLRGTMHPDAIRRQSPQHLPRLTELARHVATTVCQHIGTREPQVKQNAR